MTNEVLIFGDIEAALITHLQAALLTRRDSASVSDTGERPSSPNPRPDRLVVVNRIGGARPLLVSDSADVMFHCYDTTYPDALELAQLVRGIINALPGETLTGIHIQRVEDFAAPARMPHSISHNPRYTYTARITYRGQTEA